MRFPEIYSWILALLMKRKQKLPLVFNFNLLETLILTIAYGMNSTKLILYMQKADMIKLRTDFVYFNKKKYSSRILFFIQSF